METKLNFEAGMQELEELARALESGEMTLEASFAAFERANALRRELQKLLDEGVIGEVVGFTVNHICPGNETLCIGAISIAK